MIDLSAYNFARAEAAYVVANTPLFIVRHLRSDPAVIKIACTFSAAELVADIKERLSTVPETSRDRIIPFILLGALAVRQDRTSIARVAQLDSGHYRWFKPVAENLLATVRPVVMGTIHASVPTLPVAESLVSNKFQVLQVT